jgi:hypothetical protein
LGSYEHIPPVTSVVLHTATPLHNSDIMHSICETEIRQFDTKIKIDICIEILQKVPAFKDNFSYIRLQKDNMFSKNF